MCVALGSASAGAGAGQRDAPDATPEANFKHCRNRGHSNFPILRTQTRLALLG